MSTKPNKNIYILCLSFLSVLTIVNIIEYNRLVTVNRFDVNRDTDDVKVILTWNPFFGDVYYGFGDGLTDFEEHACAYTNCRITGDKLEMPQHKFHAIVFHGFEFYEVFYGKPKNRGVEQYYVFMSLESARRGPIPAKLHDFYNLTMTYRLDSDIPWPYFRVRDRNSTIIAPAASVSWLRGYEKPDPDLLISRKEKKIAWFVSNCHSTNGRELYVEQLRKYIQVDIYGACGDFKCPASQMGSCQKMLNEQYYFYLAFENSHCEDYITEKVLTALHSNTIPIVFSHANLSRFLPPNSYIDANMLAPRHLADAVNYLIGNPERYFEYFWWRSLYSFENAMPGDVIPEGLHPFCDLCRVLNERPDASNKKVRTWWMGTEEHPTCVV